VRFAVGIPNVAEYGDVGLLVDLAVLAERSGWDGVFVWDHLSRHGEPAADPQVTLGAIAQATERIRLGPMIIPLARRRPSKVAREMVTLDHLSDGRAVMGVGLGVADDEEFEAFGDPADRTTRGRMIDESLEVIQGLWTGEPYQHTGEHFVARTETGFRPPPVQRPRIPIWVGGTWPAKPAFRRAARFDGLFPTFRGHPAPDTVTPDLLAEAVTYALASRDPALPPLDVAIEGATPGPAPLQDYADAGLTWWVEAIGWFRGSVEQMRQVVAAGPPG